MCPDVRWKYCHHNDAVIHSMLTACFIDDVLTIIISVFKF